MNNQEMQPIIPTIRTSCFLHRETKNGAKWAWAKQMVANLYLYSCDFKYQIELCILCR